MTASHRISRAMRWTLYWRSFFLQASWSFEHMQGLGALFVLSPLLKSLYQGEELQQAYARHLSYFNTHPYVAPLLLAGIAQLESDGADTEEIKEYRQLLMAPCAAMGDAFFWGGVRPLTAVIAMFFALHGSFFAPVVLLLVFNLPHLLVRSIGLSKGFRLGYDVVEFLARCRLADLAIRLKQMTLILLGGLCALLTSTTLKEVHVPWLWGGIIVPVIIFLAWLARQRLSPMLLVLLLTSAIIAMAHFG